MGGKGSLNTQALSTCSPTHEHPFCNGGVVFQNILFSDSVQFGLWEKMLATNDEARARVKR